MSQPNNAELGSRRIVAVLSTVGLVVTGSLTATGAGVGAETTGAAATAEAARAALARSSGLAAADVAALDARTGHAGVTDALLADASAERTTSVLVVVGQASTVRPTPDPRQGGLELQAHADRLVADVAPASSRSITAPAGLTVLAMEASAQDLGELARTPGVRRIEQDALLAPALARSTVQIGAPQAWQAGATGAGRAVAVIDSGIDAAHPALVGKVRSEACFTNGACPNGAATMTGTGAGAPCTWGEGCDHGTHVAGVIAANGEQRGVAPAAELVSVQVFSRSTGPTCGGLPACPRARTSDVLAALGWVDQQATTGAGAGAGEPIVAVNLSLASDATSSGCDDSILAAAITTLWDHGVATIVAAGNSGRQGELSVPACIDRTVSVGAVDQADAYWPVSNVSAALDFFAPGVDVVSSWPGGGWHPASGTSTAAPHVAGVWAVAAQALGTTNPATIEAWFAAQAPVITVAGTATPRIDLAGLAGLGTASAGSEMSGLVADYDGNGFDDVFWYDRTGESSQIWWFGGAGREAVTPSAMGGTWRPAAGDFDHDGIGDIFWYDPSGPSSVWFGRRNRGAFEGAGPWGIYGDYTPAVGDFDGDGSDDVYLYAAGGSPSAVVWMAPTPGWPGFATIRSIGGTAAPGTGFTPTAADLDGDGDDDVVWEAPAASFLDWSNRDGSFTRRTAASPPVPGVVVVAADLDGTGADDLIRLSGTTATLWWGGLDPASGAPRAQRQVDVEPAGGARPVPGRFGTGGRDTVYFAGPALPTAAPWAPPL